MVKILNRDRWAGGDGIGVANVALAAVAIFLLFFLIALAATWPLVLNLGSQTLFLSYWGDNIAIMSTFWYSHHLATHVGAGARVNPLIGYPFGTDAKQLSSAYPLSNGVVRQLTNIFGFVAAYNIFLLMTFPLAGLAMFLLVFYVTRRYSAAIIGGFAFAFTSWHLTRAAEHLSLAAIYVVPLFVLALVYFWRKRNILSGSLVVAAWILSLLTDYHFGYFCLVITAVWVIVMLVMSYRGTNAFKPVDKKFVVIGLLLIIVAASFGFIASRASGYKSASQFSEYNPRGGFVDVVLNSSRPWNYFIPSYYNPVLGRLFRGYSLAHMGSLTFAESAAYLGIVPLLLALYAIWSTRRKGIIAGKRMGMPGGSTCAKPNELSEQICADADEGSTEIAGYRPYVVFGVSLSIITFLLSLPPEWTVFGKHIPWISQVQRWLIPPLRGYSRWAIIVLFGVMFLAGIGWAVLAEKRRYSARILIALTLAALLLIGLDYTISPPSRAKALPSVPAVLKQMLKKPEQASMVIYPLTNQNDFRLYRYEYYQTHHKHPMLNGATRATEDDLYRLAVIGYNSAYTPRILRTLGIDYAAFLSGDFDKRIHFDSSQLPAGYSFDHRAGPDYLYSIDALPAPIIPLYYSGFMAPVLFPDGRAYAPMVATSATIKLDVREAGSYVVSFLVYSPLNSRDFTFAVDGHELGSMAIPSDPVRLSLPATSLSRGKHQLSIKTASKPSVIDGKQYFTGGQLKVYMATGDFWVDETP